MRLLNSRTLSRLPRRGPSPRPLLLGLLLGCALIAAASAHNNPTFREDLLLTIPVAAEPDADGAFSEAFSLTWPKKTVQLIWRLRRTDGDPAAIRFAVAQDGNAVATDLGHEGSSGRLQGDGFTIVGVSADGPFDVEVYAKVLDRSQQKKSP